MLSQDICIAAKFSILKLLAQASLPICFRDIVSLTDVGIRSAQNTLDEFQDLDIVLKTDWKNQTRYELLENEDIAEFKKYIHYETRQQLKKRAELYCNDSKSLISALQGMYDLGQQMDSAGK